MKRMKRETFPSQRWEERLREREKSFPAYYWGAQPYLFGPGVGDRINR